jgi:hypothetical protein
MLDEAGIADVLSSCHRDGGFETVSGTQAIDFVGEKSDQVGHRCRQKRGHDEGASRDEEANRGGGVKHDEVVVSEHDSCLRVESVGERQENEGGMCWRTYRLCLQVRLSVRICFASEKSAVAHTAYATLWC